MGRTGRGIDQTGSLGDFGGCTWWAKLNFLYSLSWTKTPLVLLLSPEGQKKPFLPNFHCSRPSTLQPKVNLSLYRSRHSRAWQHAKSLPMPLEKSYSPT